VKVRSQREVVNRCRALAEEVRAALARLPEDEGEPEVVDAVWRGDALGALLWTLGLVEMPAYDEPFDHAAVVETRLDGAELRPAAELGDELASARLWHWRARTWLLQRNGNVDLPERWESFDQLVAATAMRGFEQGLLPAPLRGDFRAYDQVYRLLTPEQQAEALSIAIERHHALAWVCGAGKRWEDVPLDT
jgi:hypothetical protein